MQVQHAHNPAVSAERSSSWYILITSQSVTETCDHSPIIRAGDVFGLASDRLGNQVAPTHWSSDLGAAGTKVKRRVGELVEKVGFVAELYRSLIVGLSANRY